MFALNWCLNVPELSVLVSLDTDMPTQALRACSILANVPAATVLKHPDRWAQYLEKKNLRCRMYDLTMTPKELNDLVVAETEYWGQVPGLVVVDNIANMVSDLNYEAFRGAFIGLQKVARLRGTVVVALHHVKRDSSSGNLKLHSGSYAGEQESEIVLGLWRSTGSLDVGVLKNRNGPADPTGGLSYSLSMSTSTHRMELLTSGRGGGPTNVSSVSEYPAVSPQAQGAS